MTHHTKGMYYDIFKILQEYLNFTATLHKRKDSKFGVAQVSSNGTITTTYLHADVATGYADIALAR